MERNNVRYCRWAGRLLGDESVYGALAECFPNTTSGAGLPFGAAVWLIADEGILLALGLSKSAKEYPPLIHAYAFTSHLVYGWATELGRRAVRHVL